MSKKKKNLEERLFHSECKTIDHLVERLEKYGYTNIQKNLFYSTKYGEGEFDVLAKSPYGYLLYIEVKNNFNKKSEKRAIEQFERANLCFPKKKIKFVMYDFNGHAKRYRCKNGKK